MPVLSIEAKNAILDGWLGPNRGTGSPDDYEVEGWIDDPSTVGAQEADFGGYTPATQDSDDWGPAEGGETSTTGLVNLGTPTTTGSDAIRYWALRNTTSGELAFSAPLSRPAFPVVGVPARIRPVIQHR